MPDAGQQILSDVGTGAAAGTAIGNPLLGAAAGGLVGLGSAAFGLYQANQAKKAMAANKAPVYQIPPEVQANLTDAQRMALEGLPDEQKEQYINNLQRSQSFGLNALNSRRAGLAGLGGIVNSTNEGYNTLFSEDASARQKNIQNLMAQRSNLADYKNAAFETNQLNPYLRQDTYEKGIQGAGIQNVFGGLGTAAHAAAYLGQGNSRSANNTTANTNPSQSYNPPSPVGAQGGYGTGIQSNGAGMGIGFDPNANYQ